MTNDKGQRGWIVGLLRDRHIELPRLRREIDRLVVENDRYRSALTALAGPWDADTAPKTVARKALDA